MIAAETDEYSNRETVAEPVDPMAIIGAAAEGGNLVELLDPSELGRIGSEAVRLYRLDRDSMKEWLDRMKRGIDLAKLVKEDKTYPWAGAANVKYPLITTAALQFNARAYPAIVAPDAPVKVKTHGVDPDGSKAARAERVAAHMSWQLLVQMEEWEEETDKLLAQLPIVGTIVRKVWYDPSVGRPRCRVIAPGAFVVNDKVKALGEAPRMTEEIALYPDEIESRIRSGSFFDQRYLEGDGEDSQAARDFIEQHCRLDLDDDGYEEPYVVTVHVATEKVARIVGDFADEDVSWEIETQMVPVVGMMPDPMTGAPVEIQTMQPQEVRTGVRSIKRNSYFVAYHFLPSMDGGFLGTGLGVLLGDISESINSIINMMMDAGHMASLGGGFIGKDFRIKGASSRFRPGEWKQVSASGSAIRESIVPMTFPGPDATLFQLLGLLIEAGREVSSVKDVLMGDSGGRAMTATTTMALIEQGMAQFTAAYKRIFRALRQEYRLIARINATTVDPEQYQQFHDQQADPRADYAAGDMDITPVADPRSVTKMQEAAKAQVVMEMAQGGMVDPVEASGRILEAAAIPDREKLAPKPNPIQQQMEMMGVKAAEADLTLKMVDIDRALAEIEETRSKTIKNLSDAGATQAGVRLEQMKTRLEAVRDGLAQLVGERPGAGPVGMAGFPGGSGGQGGPVPLSLAPGAPAPRPLVVGAGGR